MNQFIELFDVYLFISYFIGWMNQFIELFDVYLFIPYSNQFIKLCLVLICLFNIL